MLIVPNTVKSAPHLVEYLLGSPNAPARSGIAFCVVIRQDAPKREVRILFLQELPPICAVENFLKPRSLNTLAKQSWFASSLFSCMTLLLGDWFLGNIPPPDYVRADF